MSIGAKSAALFVASALLAIAIPAQVLAEPLSPAMEGARVVGATKTYATHRALSPGVYPFYTRGSSWGTVNSKSWGSGFLPGSLWYEFQRTGAVSWRTAAKQRQAPLAWNQSNTRNHDIGFILLNSYRNGYRLTADPAYRSVLSNGATSLATRYNPRIGMVRTTNTPRDFWVYNDTMMNIELLFWGANNGGSAAWRAMAQKHALRTVRDFLRSDGSSYHYVAYNERTGAVIDKGQGQGYAKESTWSRGQAWIIYGLAAAYRETADPRLLTGAHRATDYWKTHVPADKIPYWDFDAPGIPNEPRDSSAAAIAASAFVELGMIDPSVARRIEYMGLARETLESLSSPAYLAEGDPTPSTLLHGTYAETVHASDHGTSWGDYYFAEGLQRLRTEVWRYAAPDRYTTAVRVSQLSFDAADTVVVASGDVFSDALAASSLAGVYDAPVLLTRQSSLQGSVASEIRRLGASRVYIVGGPRSVGWGVQRGLGDLPGVSVLRVNGPDRYAVAAGVADIVADEKGAAYDGRVFLVRGDVFADALAVSPVAFSAGIPVLLTAPTALPAPTRAALADTRNDHVVIVGGPSSVSWGIAGKIGAMPHLGVERVHAADRYYTAGAFADWAMSESLANADFVGVAVGTDYPDALMGGSGVGTHGGVLLMTGTNTLHPAARGFLSRRGSAATQARILGGEQRISAYTENQVRNALPEQ